MPGTGPSTQSQLSAHVLDADMPGLQSQGLTAGAAELPQTCLLPRETPMRESGLKPIGAPQPPLPKAVGPTLAWGRENLVQILVLQQRSQEKEKQIKIILYIWQFIACQLHFEKLVHTHLPTKLAEIKNKNS